jgi:diguanylate cyclase (GGDEF)-like protein
VQNKEFIAESETIHVTVSIGVSQVLPSDTNHIQLVERADKALSLAKNKGCDQVQIFKEDMAI